LFNCLANKLDFDNRTKSSGKESKAALLKDDRESKTSTDENANHFYFCSSNVEAVSLKNFGKPRNKKQSDQFKGTFSSDTAVLRRAGSLPASPDSAFSSNSGSSCERYL